jgi:PPK2 family polyphosphate:nucleotide phosphotransferase
MAHTLQELARDIDGKEARRIRDAIREQLLVAPGQKAGLSKRDTAWDGGEELRELAEGDLKAAAKEFLAQGVAMLAQEQELLWASDTYALLVVLQGMDAAGKDSTIKHVMAGVNPQGVHVTSFKQPSAEELDHDYLWRISKALPERGRIGIFNRSHYEEVIAVRVHPEWLEKQKLPPGAIDGRFWQKRFEDINNFERHLHQSGTRIVKFFLHISKKEQEERFLARLEDPEKHWKFNAADVAERERWDDYMRYYDEAITATSTKHAPWYVIPADRKPVMRAMVVGVLLDTIRELDLEWPKPSEEERKALDEARRQLKSR